MSNLFRNISKPTILAAMAATIAVRASYAGPGPSPRPAGMSGNAPNKVWHVRYMGGPEPLRRGTRVELRIAPGAISYRPVGASASPMFSIPVQTVTGVSDGVIAGTRDEKVFGPDEPDLLGSCVDMEREADALNSQSETAGFLVPLSTKELKSDFKSTEALGCFSGGMAVTAPLVIIKDVLSSLHYTDRFVRVDWKSQVGDSEVVFQVREPDFDPLRESLESVTSEWIEAASAITDSQDENRKSTLAASGLSRTNVGDVQFDRWVRNQCETGTGSALASFGPARSARDLGLCPLASSQEAAEARLRAH